MPNDEHRAVALTWFRANEEAICGDSFPVASLATLIAEREAAARARAVEEAASVVDRKVSNGHVRRCLVDSIRALTPDPALVVVRREDLRTLRESADVDAENLERHSADETVAPEERERSARNAAIIRAALARMGESDG